MFEDRQAVVDLVDELGLWLDEKRFGEAGELLTEDVRVQTPGGGAEGTERGAARAARTRAVPTQHVITTIRGALDGDRAPAGANLVVTFAGGGLRPLGERSASEARRTPEGWRLSSIRVT